MTILELGRIHECVGRVWMWLVNKCRPAPSLHPQVPRVHWISIFFFFFLNSKALFLLACRSQIKQVKDSPVQLCFQSMCSIIMDINRSKNCGFVVGFGASFRKSQP